jgi:hypothetical protein
MRTLLFILGGSALGAMLRVGARCFGVATKTATLAFAVLWCTIAVANLCIGVARAGYALGEELPIFLLIWLLPIGIAWVVT